MDLIESVARAICAKTNIAMEGVTELVLDNPDFVIPAHKRTDGKAIARWELYIDQARSALGATRTFFHEKAMAAEFEADPEYDLFKAVDEIDRALKP